MQLREKRTSIQYLLRIGAQGSQLRNRYCTQEAVKNVGDDSCSKKYRLFDLFLKYEKGKRYSTRATQKKRGISVSNKKCTSLKSEAESTHNTITKQSFSKEAFPWNRTQGI